MTDSVQHQASDTSHGEIDHATTATELLADAAKVAAKLSVDASVTAQNVIATAADVAQRERGRQELHREETKEAFVEALNKVFGEKTEKEQFINLSRVPFLCVQVKEIHGQLESIVLALEGFKVTQKIVYAVAGLFGSAMVVSFGIFLSILLKK